MAYRPTTAKYVGGADEYYITYDLGQRVRGGKERTLPRVKRVYVHGTVRNWDVGDFRRRTGRKVHGVRIHYTRSRSGFRRGAFTGRRGKTRYDVAPSRVPRGRTHIQKVVTVPKRARHVRLRTRRLPERYRSALQDVK